MDEYDARRRLTEALDRAEPHLPGVMPAEPQQERFAGMDERERAEPRREAAEPDAERGATFLAGLNEKIEKHSDGPTAGYGESLTGLRDLILDYYGDVPPPQFAQAIGRDLRENGGLMEMTYAKDLVPELVRAAQEGPAQPEQQASPAQFLRDEDRTRPMPRPTMAMPGMDMYVGPVYPMNPSGFDAQAWGAYRDGPARQDAPQAAPEAAPEAREVPENSAIDRLMKAMDGPPQGQEAMQDAAGMEAGPGRQEMASARDRLAAVMEKIDPGSTSRTDEERTERLLAQMAATQEQRQAERGM